MGGTKRATFDQEYAEIGPTSTVTSPKPSITGVTNSGATLPGTPTKW